MLNWYGNHKIGVLGSSNSGKTILLTSLLWHLYNHDPERFALADQVKISNFKQKKYEQNNFNFELYKNTFTQRHTWPDKTTDFSIADCRYSRQGCLCERHIKFVDIPGERVSDILLWTAKSYSEWVKSLYDFWQESPNIKDIMNEYWKKASNVGIGINQLNIAYKTAMWKMLDCFCPITPSTYLLGTDGRMLGDKHNPREQAIQSRPIWDKGELLPVPESWRQERSLEYKTFEKNFKLYKKQVLKPLFDEIEDCDNFIFCVDVLNILMSGPELLLQTQREFRDFIEHLAPSKLGRLLNLVGNNPPRLAFVATKSDMVPAEDKDKFKYLLKDFSEPLVAAGVKHRYFICSACVSTEMREDQLIGRDFENPQDHILIQCNLPESWPDQWNGEDYLTPNVAPVVSVTRAPEQVNLNTLFEFIVEDVEK